MILAAVAADLGWVLLAMKLSHHLFGLRHGHVN
jgi:hypothetical protein